MPFEKVEFSFPEPDGAEESSAIEVEASSAVNMVTPNKESTKSEDTNFEVESNTSVKGITMNVAQKKQLFVSEKNLNDILRS